MVKRAAALVAVACVLFGLALAAESASEASRVGTLVVSPDGPLRSVAAAVKLAPAGGRILVRSGLYHEGPIVIDRPVELIGEGRPEIRGRGNHQLMTVTADRVVVRGLVLANVARSHVDDRAALRFDRVSDCVAEDLEIRDAYFGIYAAGVTNCRIRNNTIAGPRAPAARAGNAIHLWSSRYMEIQGNRVTGHRDGLYFEFVQDTRVERNISTGNARYGLHFMFSDRCAYRDNEFRHNGAGVAVMYTKEIVVERNRFVGNRGSSSYGLLLKDITDSRLEENLFANNTVGLLVEDGGRVIVCGNEFRDNGWAVKLMANSLQNRFEGNSFAGNSFDIATNSRSNDSRFASNWWDRYEGYDLDRDGHGDVPFRPVRLFSLLVTAHPPAVILLRSLFADLLDTTERMLPVLTPDTLIDAAPLMEPPR